MVRMNAGLQKKVFVHFVHCLLNHYHMTLVMCLMDSPVAAAADADDADQLKISLAVAVNHYLGVLGALVLSLEDMQWNCS